MFEKMVVWVDDEPSLMDAELFDLENHHFVCKPFHWVGDALIWLTENKEQLHKIRGIVVDVQMPSRDDERFSGENGYPVGVKFCENLLSDAELWEIVQSKIILYTRLPMGSRAARIAENFAKKNRIDFSKKTPASRVALDLIKDQLITGSV